MEVLYQSQLKGPIKLIYYILQNQIDERTDDFSIN
jgi:hypothetical protein